jgi:hypothetical protein
MKNFTDQTALTLIAEIKDNCFTDLEKKLKTINDNLSGNDLIVFKNIKGVHFCRFVILPACKDLDDNIIPNQLIYSSNFDDTLDSHIRAIIDSDAKNGFKEIFSLCKNFDTTSTTEKAIKDFIIQNQKKVHAFYKGYQGLTLDIIEEEQHLNQTIQKFLNDKNNVFDKDAKLSEIKKNIENHVKQIFPDRKPTEEINLGKINDKLTIFLILLRILFPAVCVWFVFYIFRFGFYGFWGIISLILIAILYLLILECTDKELDITTVKNDGRINKLTLMEDKTVQNQFSHVVLIKKGYFRRSLQWIALWFLHTNIKYTDNVGNLSGITSIHFARWSMIDEGRRLLFFSNFDGSWENYLSDFVDRAAKGLTLAWSNTIEFPRTMFLVFKGATKENLFKAVVRKNQIETNVWYSAYPTLTVKEIYRNHKIALGIGKKMNNSELKNWLKLF